MSGKNSQNQENLEGVSETPQIDPNSWPSTSDQTAEHSFSAQGVHSTPELDESVIESEISKLSLIQLKKYYRWRILGTDFSEALAKCREIGLIPPTTHSHPNCKLSWDEIKEVSSLITGRHARSKFEIETYFGGKDPEEHLKFTLSSSKERHPDCKQSWGDLMKMAHELPTVPLKLAFVVKTFYEGEKPRKTLKTLLPPVVPIDKSSASIETSVEPARSRENEVSRVDSITHQGNVAASCSAREAAQNLVMKMGPKTPKNKIGRGVSAAHHRQGVPGAALHPACASGKGSVDHNVFSSTRDTSSGQSMSKADLSTLSFDRLLEYHKWLIQGSTSGQALMKAKELVPKPHSSSSLSLDSNCGSTFYDDPTTIEGGPVIRNMLNGKLKHYYLWRNSGYHEKDALSKVKVLEDYSGKDLPHPKCKESFSYLKRMSAQFVDNLSRDRFLIHTYYGGKDPERTMKYLIWRNGKPDDPEDEWYSFNNHIKGIEGIGLGNGKLKYYYLWLNRGYNHKEALSKLADGENIPGIHKAHPDCKYSREELMKIAQALKSDTHTMARFLIHTYFGGKDPEGTLNYFLSQNTKTDEPEDVLAVESLPEDEVHEPVELIKKSNGKLKFYYLWRNAGFDHETALKKVFDHDIYPGHHPKHPKCKHTRHQLMNLSQEIKSDFHLRERFLVITCFGGYDPEATLKWLKSGTRQDESEDEDGRSSPRNDLPDSYNNPVTIEDGPIRVLPNKKLKYYYLWRNAGYDIQRALTKTAHYLIPRQQSPHPNCTQSPEELKKMAEALSSDANARDRFLIHTYFGGKHPERTLRYFTSRSGKKDKTVRSSTQDEAAGGTSLMTDAAREQFLIDTYFGGKSRSERENPTDVSAESGNDSAGDGGSSECHQMKKLEDYLREGLPYELALSKVKGRAKKSIDMTKPRSSLPLPFERTRSCSQYPGIIPLDSPNHPYNQLTPIQLKNYYLWINLGCSHEEAMIKAKSPKLRPPFSRSCNVVPLEQLNSMSKTMPNEKLVKMFIVETYYAGSDPEEIKEFLLTKGHCISGSSPQQLSSIGEESASFGSEDLPCIIEEDHISHLDNGLLRCYYLWRNKVGPELALLNVKNRQNFSGTHFPHPSCKHSKIRLEKMATALLPDILACDRFFIHTYYGGKDADCALRYFLAYKEPNHPVPSTSLSQQQQNPETYGHPTDVVTAENPAYQQPCQVPGHNVRPLYQYQETRPQCAAYPDDRSLTTTRTATQTPSNQNKTSGMAGTMACLPQVSPGPSLPTKAYSDQPHGPIVNLDLPLGPIECSSYPQADGPSSKTYEPNQSTLSIHQQIRPLMNCASRSAANTQPVQNQPTELLVEEDGPILPSRKRRLTEESTSEEPSQPKKIRNEELGKVDSPAAMYIVLEGYPKEHLTQSQMDSIESSMLEAILEMDDEGAKPVFKDPVRSNGRYGITCIGQFSVNWLHMFLRAYRHRPGVLLKLTPSDDTNGRIRANAFLPPCEEDDDEKILRYIARQNKGLNVNNWTVVERWDGDFHSRMDLLIDEDSAEVLQKCSRIGFKLGLAKIVTDKDNSPRLSWFGDRNRSRLAGSPKRPHDVRPSARSPAKKPSKTDSVAPSSKSGRRSGGSPLSPSSESPSRVRFGRWMSRSRSRSPSQSSDSRAHSPNASYAEKPSWLAGIFSEKNKISDSWSLSQDGSSSQAYRKPRRSRRLRKRSGSSSSSG